MKIKVFAILLCFCLLLGNTGTVSAGEDFDEWFSAEESYAQTEAEELPSEAEGKDPENTGPVVTDPEDTDPENTDPGTTDTEDTDSNGIDPEDTGPEGSGTEDKDPEATGTGDTSTESPDPGTGPDAPAEPEEPAHEHIRSEEYSVDQKATCLENGLESIRCSVCGEIIEGTQREIPAAGRISLSQTSFTYSGKVQSPSLTVNDSMDNPLPSDYYDISYSKKSSKNAGMYSVTVTLKGDYYSGSKTLKYKIVKAANRISKVKSSVSKTLPYRTKSQKVLTFSPSVKGNAALSYRITSIKCGSKKKENGFTVSKSGVLKAAKKLARGTYTVKVKIVSATTKNYKSAAKTVTVKIKVTEKRGWHKTRSKKRYYILSNGKRAKGWKSIGKYDYYFDQSGILLQQAWTPDGYWVDADGKKLQKSTLKQFLEIAMQPVGSTMYVWGGGWNKADTGAGKEAVTIGVSARWESFFEKQTSSYDYRRTLYQIHDGLDCSGYVGWAVYNAFNTYSGNAGYVMKAEIMSRVYAGYGWGTYRSPGNVKNYHAGDIMSTNDGHVYIVIGQCADGSVVLVHSSPNGVMLSGTCTRSGKTNSEAVKLASRYMKRFYPDWYRKYPDSSRGLSYLTNYSQMRWRLGKKKMMTDPEGLAKKDAAAVLKQIFGS